MWSFGFLFAPALTIGGGTSEVQRNIIAERTLGLPHDPPGLSGSSGGTGTAGPRQPAPGPSPDPSDRPPRQAVGPPIHPRRLKKYSRTSAVTTSMPSPKIRKGPRPAMCPTRNEKFWPKNPVGSSTAGRWWR